MSADFLKFLEDSGITRETSAPRTPHTGGRPPFTWQVYGGFIEGFETKCPAQTHRVH